MTEQGHIMSIVNSLEFEGFITACIDYKNARDDSNRLEAVDTMMKGFPAIFQKLYRYKEFDDQDLVDQALV